MKSILLLVLIYLASHQACAQEFDLCTDMIIDQETEMAYGPHGIPFTGEVKCYRNKEKNILYTKHQYVNGKPIGRHIIYNKNGIPRSSTSYLPDGSRKHGFNYYLYPKRLTKKYGNVQCPADTTIACWVDRLCEKNDRDCNFP